MFRLGCPDEGELNPLKHAHLNGDPEEEVAVLRPVKRTPGSDVGLFSLDTSGKRPGQALFGGALEVIV